MKNSTKRSVLSCLFLIAVCITAANVLAGTCDDLLQFKLPGYDVVINEAKIVSDSKMAPNPYGSPVYDGVIPEYCRVDGELDKRTGYGGKPFAIGFAIAMPKEWNGRFLFQGGGGLNGTVADPMGAQNGGIPALARGFAVVTSDTGHKTGGGSFDDSFFDDQEALMNFAYQAIGKVTVAAKAVVGEYYSRPVEYSYYLGCSTGGREGMIMSQRFPNYYDGIVSGAPAIRTNFSNLGVRWLQVSLNQAAPKDENGEPVVGASLPESDRQLLANAFLAACDENDGIADEMVFDTQGCNFDPESLRCSGGKTDQCLTKKQISALKQGMAGPADCRGNLVYSPFLYDTGVTKGITSSTFIPGLLVLEDSVLGPPTNDTQMDVDKECLAESDAYAAIVDTFTWTNLSTFSGHGGKMIFYHGVSDPWFSAMDTVAYYNKVVRDGGGEEEVSQWCRLFLVPGMSHCRGGEKTLDQFDMLSAIVDWVEKGIAPDAVIATGKAFAGRSRPLCPFPKYAHYKGKGDSEDTKNFECRE